MNSSTVVLVALFAALLAGPAAARDQIRIVGSSTLYPFVTAVAEQFGKTSRFKTPIVESTGTGGGLKLFCGGVGVRHADIANASRRIKRSEVAACAKRGVDAITELQIGFDGIVLSNSRTAPQLALTLAQLFLALAKDVPSEGALIANPYRRWSDIDPSLPDVKIEVLGPPPTSGTRDAFVELAMAGGAAHIPDLAALAKKDKTAFQAIAHAIREDGAYVEAGENDNLIVQKLGANGDAFGIFGFSFLDQNGDRLRGSLIDGVEPTFEAIAEGRYPISRALYVYVKSAHVGVVPGIEDFLAELASEGASGEDGYLSDKGLIPLADGERARMRAAAVGLAPLVLEP